MSLFFFFFLYPPVQRTTFLPRPVNLCHFKIEFRVERPFRITWPVSLSAGSLADGPATWAWMPGRKESFLPTLAHSAVGQCELLAFLLRLDRFSRYPRRLPSFKSHHEAGPGSHRASSGQAGTAEADQSGDPLPTSFWRDGGIMKLA